MRHADGDPGVAQHLGHVGRHGQQIDLQPWKAPRIPLHPSHPVSGRLALSDRERGRSGIDCGHLLAAARTAPLPSPGIRSWTSRAGPWPSWPAVKPAGTPARPPGVGEAPAWPTTSPTRPSRRASGRGHRLVYGHPQPSSCRERSSDGHGPAVGNTGVHGSCSGRATTIWRDDVTNTSARCMTPRGSLASLSTSSVRRSSSSSRSSSCCRARRIRPSTT